ncbi:MAG: pitrilysin family protein [Chloroherpetonaceae bacterium]|nr:pitrilysin family protein [Chloroherpetonaceae bacterium]
MKLKNFFFTSIAIAIVTALSSCGANQTAVSTASIDRSKPPLPDAAPQVSFPEFLDTTLSNGLRVFLIESNQKPTLTMRMVIRGGSSFDGDKSGLADAVSTLLGKGSQKRTALQFAKEGDYIGASFGAGSSDDAVFVNISGLSRHQDKLFDIFTDALFNPTFPEDELEKFKRQAVSGVQTRRRTPGALASILSTQVAFGKHPYANFDDEASISSISQKDVQTYYARFFNASNASLAVVGDFKASEMLPLLEKQFGSWKAGEPAPEVANEFPIPDGISVHLVDLPGAVQSSVSVVMPASARRNPELAEFSLVSSILGGGFSGRLFQNLREKHGWTYGAYTNGNYYRQGGFFSATAEVRNVVTDSAITEILSEIKRIRTEPVPQNELVLQQEYLSGNYLLSLENPERTLVRAQDITVFGISKDYYKTYVKKVSSLTSERVLELAQKYLSAKNVYITVVGDAKEIKSKLEKFGKVTVYNTDFEPLSDLLPPALSSEALLENHFKALGGVASLKKMNSREMKGKVTIEFPGRSLDGTLEMKEKSPNKSYTKLITPVISQEIYVNGKRAVDVSPRGSNELSGKELTERLESSIFNVLFRLKENGVSLKVLGMKPTGEGMNYHTELIYPSGKVDQLVFDGNSFMLIEQITKQSTPQGTEVEAKLQYSDYRPVQVSKNKKDGTILLPYKLVRTVPQGQFTLVITSTVESYTINPTLKDDIFEKK